MCFNCIYERNIDNPPKEQKISLNLKEEQGHRFVKTKLR